MLIRLFFLFTLFFTFLLVAPAYVVAYAEECNSETYLNNIANKLHIKLDASMISKNETLYPFRITSSGQLKDLQKRRLDRNEEDHYIIQVIKETAFSSAADLCTKDKELRRIILFKFSKNKKDDKEKEAFKIKVSFVPLTAKTNGAPLFPSKVKTTNYKPFITALQNKIKKNWSPPKKRKDKRVTLRFYVNREGKAYNIKIKNSSGSRRIDKSATDAVKKSAPFLGFPEAHNKNSIQIEFTFDYNIKKTEKRPNPAPQRTKQVNYNKFIDNLKRKIKKNWRPPTQKVNSEVTLSFQINRKGEAHNIKIKNSSGNYNMDQIAIKTLQKTSPFSGFPKNHTGPDIALEFTFTYNVFNNSSTQANKPKSNRLIKVKLSEKQEELTQWLNYFKIHLNKEWNKQLPQNIKPVIFQCIIDETGLVVKCQKTKSSGDQNKDQNAQKSIKESEPFPPFPDNFKPNFTRIEIQLF